MLLLFLLVSVRRMLGREVRPQTQEQSGQEVLVYRPLLGIHVAQVSRLSNQHQQDWE